jgi:hypothetical protein
MKGVGYSLCIVPGKFGNMLIGERHPRLSV